MTNIRTHIEFLICAISQNAGAEVFERQKLICEKYGHQWSDVLSGANERVNQAGHTK